MAVSYNYDTINIEYTFVRAPINVRLNPKPVNELFVMVCLTICIQLSLATHVTVP